MSALYRNSDARASGKTGRAHSIKLAALVARQVGMVPTWPNVQTIRLAIECESESSQITLHEAAEIIVAAAKEFIRIENPLCPKWALREISRANTIDRFWFEDARWRMKDVYADFRAELAL